MLDCEKNNCIENNDKVGAEDVYFSSTINLSSITINQGESLLSIINKLDQQITLLKNRNIEIFYNDLVVEGECINKELIVDEQGRTKIKLSLDTTCIVEDSGCGCQGIEDDFIITASKYNLCGLQTATLISDCNNTVWYNQNGAEVGVGSNLIINTGGSYYAKCDGKTSNIIVITKTANCENYVYTKTKIFNKQCSNGYVGTSVAYSKNYTSVISYSDAMFQADLDSSNFETEGIAKANSEGTCIYVCPTPTNNTGCFEVYLSNAKCTNLPTPIPVPIPTSPTPVVPTPVAVCNLSINVSNIQC